VIRAKHAPPKVAGTTRIEAFSDGVIAIIITLLIFQVHVPSLANLSNAAVLRALLATAPQAISFAISFFTVAIFWVNHHHMFCGVAHTNWKLLWYNNVLLFWLSIVPFTTAFIGDYPRQQAVVALYALTLCLAALSFTLMFRYVFFHSDLMSDVIPIDERRREWKRGCWAFVLYGLAAAVAFVSVYAALAIVVFIPFLFIVPRLLRENRKADASVV
jgi:uncharacterized membrane protein